MIHTLRKVLEITLFTSALLLPLVDIFTAAQVGASEQAEQFTLMQLEEVSYLLISPDLD